MPYFFPSNSMTPSAGLWSMAPTILFFGAVIFSHGNPVCLTAQCVRIPLRPCKMSCCKRTVRHQRYPHLPANRNQFSLIFTIKKVIMVFHCLKLRPPMLFCNKLHIVKLIAIHRRSTKSTYFSRFYQIIQGFHSLLDRCLIIKPVNDVQIQCRFKE